MTYKESYNYLLDNLNNKIITIKELNNITIQTDYFDNIDGYFLSDSINNNECSFNSYENEENNQVINIDLSFLEKKDFKTIKNITWKKDSDVESMKVKINVSLYDL